jgi:hypothetical protein
MRQRPYLRGRVCRIANFETSNRGDKTLLELGRDMLMHDESLRRDARLPVVDRSRPHGNVDGPGEIGAGHDDERIAAAELQHGLLEMAAGHTRDLTAGSFASRERRGGDPPIGEQCRDCVRADEQRLKHTGGCSGVAKQLLEGESTLRHVRRVFEQSDVARD